MNPLMRKPPINGRDKDIHTKQQKDSQYMKANNIFENVEYAITKRTNCKSGSIRYKVHITVNGKHYRKTYISIEQARIFRNTIIKHTK